MSRAERRRQERARAKGRTINVPDGTLVRAQVLTGTGQVEEVTNYRELPAKRPGHHRWVVAIAHVLGDEQAEAWQEGGGQVLLDPSSVLSASLGCFDCELAYADVKGRPCAAGDTWGRG